MTDHEKKELRRWAEIFIGSGQVQARLALAAIAEIEQLQALNAQLAERVAAQSALLSRRAEKDAAPGVDGGGVGGGE